MIIPVVFVHYGASDHLPIALRQAGVFDNQTVLIRDAKGARLKIVEVDRQFNVPDALDHDFAKFYKHLSRNHYAFELECIIRWFELRDLMQREQIDQCLYLDSDVLLYANAAKEWEYYQQFDFTLCLGTTGHTSFWTRAALEQFCEFVTRIYQDRDVKYQELERIFHEMLAQDLAGGVSDMLLLKMFREQTELKVGEMCEVRGGATWDHNFNVPDSFEMNGEGVKRIEFYNGLPYGTRQTTQGDFSITEKIRFKSLHFQGGAKRLMQEYAK